MEWPELAALPLPWGNIPVTEGSGPVLLTRLLAFRNLAGEPFPVSATPNRCAAIAGRILDWLAETGFPPAAPLARLPTRAIRLLREREILPWRSVALPGKQGGKHAAWKDGGRDFALVNEVEHLALGRLFAGSPDVASAVFPDPGPGPAGIGWAISARYGFLASDPGRIGPGAAVEQVVHLPALAIARELPAARNYCLAAGLSFAPAVPLPDPAPGPADAGLFRVASHGRIGRSAAEAYADHLDALAPVLAREADRRAALLARHAEPLRTRVRKAWEKLTSAPSLSYPELLSLVSAARLGADLGFLDPETGRILDALRAKAGGGHLAVSSDRDLSREEEDISRANVVRLSMDTRHGAGT